MNSSDAVIPFGKYKGRSVEKLLTDDPPYLQWLAAERSVSNSSPGVYLVTTGAA
jgi:uncharacterized protein (DUF3820 family)